MNTMTITKRYHRPSSSTDLTHTRMMGITIVAPPFDIPPAPAVMTRAAPALSHAEKVEALRAAYRAMRPTPTLARIAREEWA